MPSFSLSFSLVSFSFLGFEFPCFFFESSPLTIEIASSRSLSVCQFCISIQTQPAASRTANLSHLCQQTLHLLLVRHKPGTTIRPRMPSLTTTSRLWFPRLNLTRDIHKLPIVPRIQLNTRRLNSGGVGSPTGPHPDIKVVLCE